MNRKRSPRYPASTRQQHFIKSRMEPSTQKLIHTFGALADLGQEVANTGDFSEMVRTSMHLLLGTLALRRGAVVECNEQRELGCVAAWGLHEALITQFAI